VHRQSTDAAEMGASGRHLTRSSAVAIARWYGRGDITEERMWRMNTFTPGGYADPVDSVERPGRARHFIERSLRPELRTGALRNEPDQPGYDATDEFAPKPKPKPKDIEE
jgi:hypothetical protein